MRGEIETREEAWFLNQTTTLWTLASQVDPYLCSSSCKAPSDFYLGVPWIDMANQTFLDGGVNARVVCRVWDGIDVGREKNSDTWMWFFNDRLLFKQEAGQGPFMDDEVTCHGKKQKT